MPGEKDLAILQKQLQPSLNDGEYVLCPVDKIDELYLPNAIGVFREKEGIKLIIDKAVVDELHLSYGLIYFWIVLTVNSSLETVGLTVAFTAALSKEGIICHVMAAFYHDPVFAMQKDSCKAMEVLRSLSQPVEAG